MNYLMLFFSINERDFVLIYVGSVLAKMQTRISLKYNDTDKYEFLTKTL